MTVWRAPGRHGAPRTQHLPSAPDQRLKMTDPLPLPEGFRVGHWTDARARTGCTVVIPPPGTRGGVDVRGGGTGTRELEGLSPLANAEGPTAVLLTGGSAFGLAAAASGRVRPERGGSHRVGVRRGRDRSGMSFGAAQRRAQCVRSSWGASLGRIDRAHRGLHGDERRRTGRACTRSAAEDGDGRLFCLAM